MFAFEKQNLWSVKVQELKQFVYLEIPQKESIKQEFQNTREGKNDSADIQAMTSDSQSVESRLQQLEQLRTERFQSIDKGSNGADTQGVKSKVDALILQSILKTPEAQVFSVLPASRLEAFDTNASQGLNTMEFRAYLENLGKVIDMILLTNLDKDGKTNNLIDLSKFATPAEKQHALAIATACPDLVDHAQLFQRLSLQELQNRADVLVQINRDLKAYKGDRAMLEATKEALLKKDFNPQDTYNQIDGYTLESTPISYAEIIARFTNDSKSTVDHFYKVDGKAEAEKTGDRAKRLQTLLETFEQKHSDTQYKVPLLQAHVLLQQNKFEDASKIVQKFVVEDLTASSIFGNAFTSEQAQLRAFTDATMSDIGLAQALRTMKDTKKAGEQFRSVIGSQEVEQGKSLDDAVSERVAKNVDKYKSLAENRFNQMLQAAQGMPELTELTNNKEGKIAKLQTVLATVGEFDKYMKENADSMQGIAKDYIDMKGLGGVFDFTDENVSLTQTLLIEAALLVLFAPEASIRIASKIPGLMKKARDAARSGKYVKQVEEVSAVPLEPTRDVARAAFSPEGTGAHNIRMGVETPRPDVAAQVERSTGFEFKAVGERLKVTQTMKQGGIKEVKVDGEILEQGEAFLDKKGNIIRFEKENGDRLQFQTLDKITGQPKGDPSYFKAGELDNKIQRVEQVAKTESVPARVVDSRVSEKIVEPTKVPEPLAQQPRPSDAQATFGYGQDTVPQALKPKSVSSSAKAESAPIKSPQERLTGTPHEQEATLDAMLRDSSSAEGRLANPQRTEEHLDAYTADARTLGHDAAENNLARSLKAPEAKPLTKQQEIQREMQNAEKEFQNYLESVGSRMENGGVSVPKNQDVVLVEFDQKLELHKQRMADLTRKEFEATIPSERPITSEKSPSFLQRLFDRKKAVEVVQGKNISEGVQALARAVNDSVLGSIPNRNRLLIGALAGLVALVYTGDQRQEALAQVMNVDFNKIGEKVPDKAQGVTRSFMPTEKPAAESLSSKKLEPGENDPAADFDRTLSPAGSEPRKEDPQTFNDLVKAAKPGQNSPVESAKPASAAEKPQSIGMVPLPNRDVAALAVVASVSEGGSGSDLENVISITDSLKSLPDSIAKAQNDTDRQKVVEKILGKIDLGKGYEITNVKNDKDGNAIVVFGEAMTDGFGNLKMTIDKNGVIKLQGTGLNLQSQLDQMNKLLTDKVPDPIKSVKEIQSVKRVSGAEVLIQSKDQAGIQKEIKKYQETHQAYYKLTDKFGYPE